MSSVLLPVWPLPFQKEGSPGQATAGLICFHSSIHSFIQTMSAEKHCLRFPICKMERVKVSYGVVGLTNVAHQEQRLEKRNTNHT